MIPVVAAIATFLLLAGAGIVWAVRRDETRRASGRRPVADVGDSVFMAYGAGGTEAAGCDVGDSGDCGGGGD